MQSIYGMLNETIEIKTYIYIVYDVKEEKKYIFLC